ncbi:MAG: hypothetical protein ACYDBY_00505 [Thermoanaerobaculia bacterium]
MGGTLGLRPFGATGLCVPFLGLGPARPGPLPADVRTEVETRFSALGPAWPGRT